MSNALVVVFRRRTFGLIHKLVCDSLAKSEVNYERNLCALSCNFRIAKKDVHTNRNFSIDSIREGSAARAETTSTTHGLSKLQAQELILRLTDEERNVLINALQEYHSKMVKEEYEGTYKLLHSNFVMQLPTYVIPLNLLYSDSFSL